MNSVGCQDERPSVIEDNMTIKTKHVSYETMIHMMIERSRACGSDTGNDDLKQLKVKTSRVMPLPKSIEASYGCDTDYDELKPLEVEEQCCDCRK